jgi:hypothetical protein
MGKQIRPQGKERRWRRSSLKCTRADAWLRLKWVAPLAVNLNGGPTSGIKRLPSTCRAKMVFGGTEVAGAGRVIE